MEMPEELLIEILVQLPVKSLLRFKCVCKNWLSVIQSPLFVESQRRLSDTRNNKLLCFRKDPVTETHVISLFDRHTLEKLEDLEWPPFLFEEGVECFEKSPREINIFGPVNGIYCIFRSLIDNWVGTLTLWNPATREHKHIHPQVSFDFPQRPLYFIQYGYLYPEDPVSLNIGFGFDRKINDYKVVVICQWEDESTGSFRHWHLRVCNLASYQWRTVYFLNDYCNRELPLFEGLDPPFPQICPQPTISSNCLLNGVFHWPCSPFDNRPGYRILTFDLTGEVLQLIEGPPLRPHLPLRSTVLVLKDTIAAIYNYDVDVEVWMMMEYGVDSSWAILFTIREVTDWIPLSIPYNDRIFFDDDGQLISLSFGDDRQVKEHGIYGVKDGIIRGSLGILNYVETLGTLKLM